MRRDVAALLAIQLLMMKRFLADPKAKALWYSGFGVPLYVLGMMVSAFAVRGLCGRRVMAGQGLGWIGIVRLGLVQAALGAIVVLTTSTINRVMIVELALPAMVPGLLVTWHYALQVLRPSWGHGSDKGGRRTPWIIAGMGALAIGGLGAAISVHLMAQNMMLGMIAAAISFTFIGGGVGAAGTSLLVLLAKNVDETRRAAAATIVWIMMIVGFIITAGLAGHFLDPFSTSRLVAVAAVICASAFLLTLAGGLEGREKCSAYGAFCQAAEAEGSLQRRPSARSGPIRPRGASPSSSSCPCSPTARRT